MGGTLPTPQPPPLLGRRGSRWGLRVDVLGYSLGPEGVREMLWCIWPPLGPQGHRSIFWRENSRSGHAKARRRHSEKGNRDQQRWRERQKRGELTTHTRSSPPQHLLQASFCVLPQSQNSLTPAFFLVLPTRSEHPVSYRPAPWPATLRLLAAPHPPRPGRSSVGAPREKRTKDRGASRRHTHETSKITQGVWTSI